MTSASMFSGRAKVEKATVPHLELSATMYAWRARAKIRDFTWLSIEFWHVNPFSTLNPVAPTNATSALISSRMRRVYGPMNAADSWRRPPTFLRSFLGQDDLRTGRFVQWGFS